MKKIQHLTMVRLFAAALLASSLFGSRSQAQNVVIDWNEIATTTIVTNGGKPAGSSGVWFAYVQIAVYDAINAIERRFQPFYYKGEAPDGASPEAAAIAAAHRVLVNFFLSQGEALDEQYGNSLANLKIDEQSKSDGVAVGEAAAAALIEARAGDGLEDDVPYTPPEGDGYWQPTPPGFLPPATPWLGEIRPFTMTKASQFLPEGPTLLDSEEWIRDYEQVRTLGEGNSNVRTPEQSEIGLFWTEHTGQQYARAFRYLAANYDLDLAETARMFAILWTGYADSVIGCFNAKYTYSFWRPVTAIRAGGGNPNLTADPDWTPLGITPNHPEYPAAHGCITGAVSHLIAGYFRTPEVHVVTDSLVTHTTHTFEDTRDLFNEVFWARIYAGFHYSHSLVDGGSLGQHIARRLLHHYFRRVRREEITTIDFPGATTTFAFGINPRGDIVGRHDTTDGVTHGFLLSGGQFTSIDFPGATATFAFGINPRGDIVGQYRLVGTAPCAPGDLDCHGYLMSGDNFTTIDFPGVTSAEAINSRGDIVGRYRSTDGVAHGFLLTREKRDEDH